MTARTSATELREGLRKLEAAKVHPFPKPAPAPVHHREAA